jgi:hypothetical protein
MGRDMAFGNAAETLPVFGTPILQRQGKIHRPEDAAATESQIFMEGNPFETVS